MSLWLSLGSQTSFELPEPESHRSARTVDEVSVNRRGQGIDVHSRTCQLGKTWVSIVSFAGASPKAQLGRCPARDRLKSWHFLPLFPYTGSLGGISKGRHSGCISCSSIWQQLKSASIPLEWSAKTHKDIEIGQQLNQLIDLSFPSSQLSCDSLENRFRSSNKTSKTNEKKKTFSEKRWKSIPSENVVFFYV